MIPRLDIEILPQPDDVTCGPTCLHAVYRYWGEEIPLQRVITEVARLENQGTLAVLLGNHALARGYSATLYTYNLRVFDPTWFGPGVDLVAKLRAQAAVKSGLRLQRVTQAYLEFLERGGDIRYEDLRPELLSGILRTETPILTGLSATHLYGSAREVEEHDRLRYDDIRGEPTGHFVLLSSWDPETGTIGIADPLREKPGFEGHRYSAPAHRVLSAVLLGALTYDANFLVVRP
ncbi:MAG: hypothetical protein ACOCUZ_00320 [bacterium]